LKTLVFLDTETTSKGPDRRPWEIGLIVRRPGKADEEHHWFIADYHLDLGNGDPESLAIGRFYQRHPGYAPPEALANPADLSWLPKDRFAPPVVEARDEWKVLRAVEQLTRDAQVWCSNPAFDIPMLDARMRYHDICPAWYYHHEDIKSLARGWLHGRNMPLPENDSTVELAKACGIDPGAYPAHTALGDCRLMRDLYDIVTGHTVA
jgi:hypothetical protein